MGLEIKMELHETLRRLAGILLIISAFTHIIQLIYVGFEWHDLAAALFGVAYGILGVLLIIFNENKPITIVAIILPVIGGTLGLVRLITIEIAQHNYINWFIVWHVIADIIIVPCCFYSYIHLSKYDQKEKINFAAIILFIITGIIHIMQPLEYGFEFLAVGALFYGIIYLVLGFYLLLSDITKQNIILSLFLTIVGLFMGLSGIIMGITPFLIFFVIIDVILIELRYVLLKMIR